VRNGTEEVDQDSRESGVRLEALDLGSDFNLESTVLIPVTKPKLFLAFLSQSQEHVVFMRTISR